MSFKAYFYAWKQQLFPSGCSEADKPHTLLTLNRLLWHRCNAGCPICVNANPLPASQTVTSVLAGCCHQCIVASKHICCYTHYLLHNHVTTSYFAINIYDVGRDGVDGVATRYGLNSMRIESRWGEILRFRPDRPWHPTRLLQHWYRVFPRGKAVGAWPCPPTPSNAEVKERVHLYLNSPSGPSWSVVGWTLLLPLPFYIYIYIYVYLSLNISLRLWGGKKRNVWLLN